MIPENLSATFSFFCFPPSASFLGLSFFKKNVFLGELNSVKGSLQQSPSFLAHTPYPPPPPPTFLPKLSVWMVKFFSFPFFKCKCGWEWKCQGSGFRQRGAGGSLWLSLPSGEIRAQLNPLEPSPCLRVPGAASYSFHWSQGNFVTRTSFF